MTYQDLKKFITQDMSMAHIYQPVMLIELLKNKGSASEEQIAQVILNRDPTQIDYYIDKVKNMVGKVLAKREVTTKVKSMHSLNGFSELSQEQIDDLINLCMDKLVEYENKRGDKIWEHRATDREAISGSVRYQVLLRAERRCESCGASVADKAIDVDHIVPRSLGGLNDISNYQALCWECNTNKGNRDKTDFHKLEQQYLHREDGCLFCDIQSGAVKGFADQSRVVNENSLAYLTMDYYPVTEFHSLIVPKRHVRDYFQLTQAEINAMNQLLQDQKNTLDKLDKTIDGYNIGMNCGETAGQTIFHCHMHLIPRRKGDVENPRGGIRHVIPNKGFYKEKS
jgi:diadenosine tetraphosphate (Ap4A) HIT family hydrolase/5-methylcytosine-specific restriction endonuclease McrA